MPIDISNDSIDISSENQTEELANRFSKKLNKGDVIFFYGEMGVGKTTFIKYLINKLQQENKIATTEITSPTFNLLNEYQINKMNIFHYDLFRLKSTKELKNLDLFSDRFSGITLIEWPEIIKEKPKNLIELIFEYDENYKKRFVKIK